MIESGRGQTEDYPTMPCFSGCKHFYNSGIVSDFFNCRLPKACWAKCASGIKKSRAPAHEATRSKLPKNCQGGVGRLLGQRVRKPSWLPAVQVRVALCRNGGMARFTQSPLQANNSPLPLKHLFYGSADICTVLFYLPYLTYWHTKIGIPYSSVFFFLFFLLAIFRPLASLLLRSLDKFLLIDLV